MRYRRLASSAARKPSNSSPPGTKRMTNQSSAFSALFSGFNLIHIFHFGRRGRDASVLTSSVSDHREPRSHGVVTTVSIKHASDGAL